MADNRLLRILSLWSAHSSGMADIAGLCTVSAEVTGTTGAGIVVINPEGQQESVSTSDTVSARIEDLEFTLGEGPCVEAHAADRPIFEVDLAVPEQVRWPFFSPAALEAGARAVFGFPVRVGAARLGALNLYRDLPGPMSDDQYADALVLADLIARALLAAQGEAPSGHLIDELNDGVGFRSVVHQASGMVALQLGVGVGEALVRLRSHAFANGELVNDIAEKVVSRRMRFSEHGGARREHNGEQEN